MTLVVLWGKMNLLCWIFPKGLLFFTMRLLWTNWMTTLQRKGIDWSKWLMLHLNGGNTNSLNQTSLAVTQKHFSNPVKEQHQKTTHSMPHGKCKKSYLILEMEQRSKNKPNTMRQSITQRIQQEKATLSLGETRTPTQHGVMSKITALWRERGSIIIIFNNNPLSHH